MRCARRGTTALPASPLESHLLPSLTLLYPRRLYPLQPEGLPFLRLEIHDGPLPADVFTFSSPVTGLHVEAGLFLMAQPTIDAFFQASGFDLSFVQSESVPEPSTVLLLVFGAGVMLRWRTRSARVAVTSCSPLSSARPGRHPGPCARALAPTRSRSRSWASAPSPRLERHAPSLLVVARELKVVTLLCHPGCNPTNAGPRVEVAARACSATIIQGISSPANPSAAEESAALVEDALFAHVRQVRSRAAGASMIDSGNAHCDVPCVLTALSRRSMIAHRFVEA